MWLRRVSDASVMCYNDLEHPGGVECVLVVLKNDTFGPCKFVALRFLCFLKLELLEI